jgi:hypothetical protein
MISLTTCKLGIALRLELLRSAQRATGQGSKKQTGLTWGLSMAVIVMLTISN